jgi:VanZ family protein
MNRVLYFSFALVWTALIFHNSLQPGTAEQIKEASGLLSGFFSLFGINPKTGSAIISAGAHAFEFFFLAVFLAWFVRSLNLTRPYFISWSLSLLLAVFDEFVQGYVPTRVSSVSDVLIDCFGALFGALASYTAGRLFQPRFSEIGIIRNSFLQTP